MLSVALLSLLSLPPGRDRYMTQCPVHAERTASCAVSRRGRDQRWRWHCFGCGEGGDAIDLLMKRDRLTYAQARAACDWLQGDGAKYKPQQGARQDASRAAPAWVLVCDACQLERCDLDSAERLGWEVGSCRTIGVGPDCLERATRRRLGLPALVGPVTFAAGTTVEGTDPAEWVRVQGALPFLWRAASLERGILRGDIS